MAQLTADSKVVLKLQLGENGTRRIAFRKLWDVSKSTVSYQHVADLALSFSLPEGKKFDRYEVTITYADLDGDVITISTDTELADAFGQFVNTDPPVLRATATVKLVNNKKKQIALFKDGKTKSSAPSPGSNVEGAVGLKINQVQSVMESFVSILSTTIVTLQQHIGKLDNPTNSSSASTALTARATPSAAAAARNISLQSSFAETLDQVSRNQVAKDGATDALLKDVISETLFKSDESEVTSLPDLSLLREADTLLEDVISKTSFKSDDSEGAHMPDLKVSKEAEPVAEELEALRVTNESELSKLEVQPDSPVPIGGDGLAISACKSGCPKTTEMLELLKIDEPARLEFSNDRNDGVSPQMTEEFETSSTSTASTKPELPKKPEVPAGFDPGFIHGRHTCDGCLSTPIFGIRYHALNLPDYDLCSKCFDNYQWNEIVFEPAELDRDRPVQERWRRREARSSRQARLSCQAELGHIFVPPGRYRGIRHQIKNISDDMDANLKEAIRRSLLDVSQEKTPSVAKLAEKSKFSIDASDSVMKPEEADTLEKTTEVLDASVKQPIAVITPTNSSVADVLEKVSVTSDILEDKSMIFSDLASHTNDEFAPVQSTLDAESNQVIPAINGVSSDEDSLTNIVPEEKVSELAFTVESPKVKKHSFTILSEGKEKAEDSVIVKTREADEAVDTLKSDTHTSVPVEKKNSFVKKASNGSFSYDAEGCGDIISVRVEKKNSSVRKSSNGSFSHDAEGSGDIAMAIGTTLDNFAHSIDEIVSEFEKSGIISSNSSMSEPEIIFEEDDADVNSLLAPPGELDDEDSTRAGATILASLDTQKEDKFESDENISDDEWQILEEEGQIAHDEMIARATQLIGSSLFQSDMSCLGDEVAPRNFRSPSSKPEKLDPLASTLSTTGSAASSPNLSNSSKSFTSSASSVPTSVPSVMSFRSCSSISSRWEPELRHLHELGFLDDRRSINVLERLEAANIGVNSNDPVTVNDVVDYLLSGRD